jgi:hypothetical protein
MRVSLSFYSETPLAQLLGILRQLSQRTAAVWATSFESELPRYLKEMNFLSVHQSSGFQRNPYFLGFDQSAHRPRRLPRLRRTTPEQNLLIRSCTLAVRSE